MVIVTVTVRLAYADSDMAEADAEDVVDRIGNYCGDRLDPAVLKVTSSVEKFDVPDPGVDDEEAYDKWNDEVNRILEEGGA